MIARLAFLSLLLLVTGCTSPGKGTSLDSAEVAGYKLHLVEQDGGCRLNYSGPQGQGQLALKVAPPAYFLRRGSREVQTRAYPDKGIDALVIVTGTPGSPERLKLWGATPSAKCGTELQGVQIGKKGISVTAEVLRSGLWFRDKGTDEKDFWSFAHPVAP